MATTADHWLVRTAHNLIAGPYTREQVCTLIRDGQLTHQDEVCHARGYWITLHEREEVKKQLGVDVPHAAGSTDEEVTETGTEKPDRTDDAIPAPAAVEVEVQMQSPPEGASASAPVLQDTDGHTAFVSPEMLRGIQGQATAGSASPEARVQTTPSAPRPEPAQAQHQHSPTPAPGPKAGTGIRPAWVGGELARGQVTPTQIERPSFWRGFALILVLAAAGVAFAVIRLLRSGQG